MSCQRCKQSGNGPQAFLLTCRGCSKTWHHRCHMPPVEDEELIRRIRATNARDAANGLSTWMCRRCKKSASATPSATSSREPTVSSASHEDRKTSGYRPAVTDSDLSTSTPATSAASTVEVRAKQESSTTANVQPFGDLERNRKSDRQELSEAAPMKRILSAKRTKPSAANHPHVQLQPGPAQPRDADVEMEDTTPTTSTPQEMTISPQGPSLPTLLHRGKSARKFVETIPATSSEDDVQMKVEVSPPGCSDSTSLASSSSQAPCSSNNLAIWPASVSEALPHMHTASSTSESEWEVRPADGSSFQPQVNQDVASVIDDGPDDLYGPPVERHIIRILPSLAQELREQRQRVAAKKEKQRAPLAPDWILAKHAHDPLWKEVPSEGRKRQKSAARKLGDNGLNVSELMGYFTVQNFAREHET